MIPKACKRLAGVDFPIAEVSRHAGLLARREREAPEVRRLQPNFETEARAMRVVMSTSEPRAVKSTTSPRRTWATT